MAVDEGPECVEVIMEDGECQGGFDHVWTTAPQIEQLQATHESIPRTQIGQSLV